MNALERTRKWQQKAVLNGFCICCAAKIPNDHKFKLCPSCLEKRRQHQHNIRKTRLNKGLCPRCGRNKPADGFTLCQACHDRGANNAEKLSQTRKAKGLCCYCGQRPLMTAFYCALCYEQKKKDNKMRRAESGEYKGVPANILRRVRRFFGLKNMINIHKTRLQRAYASKRINVAIGHVKAIKTCKARLLEEFGYDIENA